jgi:hypothetical protein
MENHIKRINFASVKNVEDGLIKFKVDVKLKENLIQRITNLFRSERVCSVWMDESQASSTSNYLYNEIKKHKKQSLPKEEKVVEALVDKNLEKMVDSACQVEEARPKPKRRYAKKPKSSSSAS